MKIWRNKKNTRALKIDSIDYWNYTSAEHTPHLFLKVHGGNISFQGDEANEIYNILKNQKEVL